MICLKDGVHNLVRFQSFYNKFKTNFDAKTILIDSYPIYAIDKNTDTPTKSDYIPVHKGDWDLKIKRAIKSEDRYFLLGDDKETLNNTIKERIVSFVVKFDPNSNQNIRSKIYSINLDKNLKDLGFTSSTIEMEVMYHPNTDHYRYLIYPRRSFTKYMTSDIFYIIFHAFNGLNGSDSDITVHSHYRFDIANIDFFKDRLQVEPKGKFNVQILGGVLESQQLTIHFRYEGEGKEHIVGLQMNLNGSSILTKIVYKLTIDSQNIDSLIGAAVMSLKNSSYSIITQKRIYNLGGIQSGSSLSKRNIPSLPGVTLLSTNTKYYAVSVIDFMCDSREFDSNYYSGSFVRVQSIDYDRSFNTSSDTVPKIKSVRVSIEKYSASDRSQRAVLKEIKQILIMPELKAGSSECFRLEEQGVYRDAVINMVGQGQKMFVVDRDSFKMLEMENKSVLRVNTKELSARNTTLNLQVGEKPYQLKFSTVDLINDGPQISLSKFEPLIFPQRLQRLPLANINIRNTFKNIKLGGDIDQKKSFIFGERILPTKMSTSLDVPPNTVMNDVFPIGDRLFLLTEKTTNENLNTKRYLRIVKCSFNITDTNTIVLSKCSVLNSSFSHYKKQNQLTTEIAPGYIVVSVVEYKDTIAIALSNRNLNKSSVIEFLKTNFYYRKVESGLSVIKNMFDSYSIQKAFIKNNSLTLLLKGSSQATALVEFDYDTRRKGFNFDQNVNIKINESDKYKDRMVDAFPSKTEEKSAYLRLNRIGINKKVFGYSYIKYDFEKNIELNEEYHSNYPRPGCPLSNELFEYDEGEKTIHISQKSYEINKLKQKTGGGIVLFKSHIFDYKSLEIASIIQMECLSKNNMVQFLVIKIDGSKAVLTMREILDGDPYTRIHSLVSIDKSVRQIRTSSTNLGFVITMLNTNKNIVTEKEFDVLVLNLKDIQVYAYFDLKNNQKKALVTLSPEGSTPTQNQKMTFKVNGYIKKPDIKEDKQEDEKQEAKTYKIADKLNLREFFPNNTDIMSIVPYSTFDKTKYKFHPRFAQIDDGDLDKLNLNYENQKSIYKKIVQSGQIVGISTSTNGYYITTTAENKIDSIIPIDGIKDKSNCYFKEISMVEGKHEGPKLLFYCYLQKYLSMNFIEPVTTESKVDGKTIKKIEAQRILTNNRILVNEDPKFLHIFNLGNLPLKGKDTQVLISIFFDDKNYRLESNVFLK